MNNKLVLSNSHDKWFPIKQVSPEEFFQTKKKNRRIKTSLCFQDTNVSQSPCFVREEEINFIFEQEDPQTKSQLQSTFGGETYLFEELPLLNLKNRKGLLRKSSRLDSLVYSDDEPLYYPQTIISRPTSQQNSVGAYNAISFQSNTSIQDFIFIKKLGEGSYSQVFQVIQKKTGFIYALKVLEKQSIKQSETELALIREIKITMFLNHPNIAKLYHFFDDEQYVYLLCEYSTDKNVFELMNETRFKLKKGLFTHKVKDIIGQVCEAVRFMHNNSVWHRDIKPENVLLTMFDTVKLCDFGWAVHVNGEEVRSTFCGTPLYLAPEMIASQQYNNAVDIWAIGILTFELMTQHNPFRIQSFEDLNKILSQQINFSGVRNKLAQNFIRKALIKDPAKRISIGYLLSHPFLERNILTHS